MIYVSINGTRLDEIVQGFVLESVKGRELLASDITSYTINGRNGAIYQRKQQAARTLVINYGIVTRNRTALIEAYTKLADVLNTSEEAQWTFSDEPNVYYVGTVGEVSQPTGYNFAKQGEFNIFCADPYKYAVTETVVTSTTETIDETPVTVLTTNYDGTAPAFPIFNVQFDADVQSGGSIGQAGDCGYVMITKNGTDYSLQFGDDEEQDTITAYSSIDFTKAARGGAWSDTTTANLPTGYGPLATKPTGATAYVSNGGGVRASTYGNKQTKKFYGPMCLGTLEVPAFDEFEISWSQITCVHPTTATGKTQMGANLIVLYDANGTPVYAVGLIKPNATSLNGSLVWFDATGMKILKTVSLAKTGVFGYTSASGGGRYSTNKIKRVLRNDKWFILLETAAGNFELGGYDECPTISKVGLWFGKYDSYATMYINAVHTLTYNGGEVDLINTFKSGDTLDVDTGSLSVELNNKPAAYLGDVANSWQDVTVDKGANMFICQYSNWVSKPPVFTMKYRKRWL